MTHAFMVVLLLAVICVVLLALVIRRLTTHKKEALPYALKSSLFTAAERSFLGCLDSVLSPEIRVFAKVRLADLFEVRKTSDRSAWQSAFNKINSKHVDFVAIELDDKSHAREDRRVRDDFLDRLFAEANLNLIRFKVQRDYRPEEIASRVNEALASARDRLH
jgi:hypothetical protein